jgi:flap endonuclease-1
MREQANREWQNALKTGDYATAFSKAVMSSHLTRPMIEDSKRLLRLLGIPFVQAPNEAEAQGAYMAQVGDVWAASSKDYDSLMFGAPQLVRYLTISGREFLPSKGTSRPLKPELIELNKFLESHGITRRQLVDIAILIGTDFNEGVKGIGPKTALQLIKEHGTIEKALPALKNAEFPVEPQRIREIFLHPKVTDNYPLVWRDPDPDGVVEFMCGERDF